MIWPIALLGLALTLFGATVAAALITSSRARLAEAVARRLRGGAESLGWVPLLERHLAAASVTTTLGITTLGAVFPAMFADAGILEFIALLLLVVLPVVVLSGYVLPRWLTRSRASRVTDRLQAVMRPWSALLGWILPAPSVEPEALISELWRERLAGTTPDDRLLRVGGVISFSERTVREVMTPRTELVAIPEEATTEEVRQAFLQTGYSRLPVYRGTLDEIIGMVHVFDMFRLVPGGPLPVRSVAVAPAGRPCGDVLIDMQRERRHLAVVLDEFGGTLGIVTLEDLLEALVGEIVDEDVPPILPAVAGPSLLEAEGGMPVTDVEAHFGVELPAGHAASIGGRLIELAGRFPVRGERFLIRGLELDVVSATPTRVERLLIRRAAPLGIPLERVAT